MGFQDNSGDIILDMTLTDLGRLRLARGDGSFNITKYAFGDDEINYGLIDTSQVNTALRDLQVLKTPILEAASNSRVGIKHFLTSIPRTNLLYYPSFVLNNLRDNAGLTRGDSTGLGNAMYVVTVNKSTDNAIFNSDSGTNFYYGVQRGRSINSTENCVMIEQGIDNDNLGKDPLGGDLVENQFIIQMNDSLCTLVSGQPGSDIRAARPNFVDENRIATYNITSLQGSGAFVRNMRTVNIDNAEDVTEDNKMTVIKGLRGTEMRFRLRPSRNLRTSDFLFERYGNQTLTFNTQTFKYIDTSVKVMGGNTGAYITIPVRFVKLSGS